MEWKIRWVKMKKTKFNDTRTLRRTRRCGDLLFILRSSLGVALSRTTHRLVVSPRFKCVYFQLLHCHVLQSRRNVACV